MQKRIVPFLIIAMSISLIGIIVIQYKWIQNALNEKQNLINNQVQVILGKVEEQLSDLKGIELIKSRVERVSRKDSLTVSKSSSYSITATGDSISMLKIGVFNDFDQSTGLNFIDEVITIKDSISDINIKDEVQTIMRLIKKVKVEKSVDTSDIRIDSTHVSKILNTELKNLGKVKIASWGLFDHNTQDYVIKPVNVGQIDYKKNLFSTDLISPNRYQLQLGIDANQLIWKDIKLMILLSLLFLLIIAAAFTFSIRLLLKHKRISEIKSDFINNMTHEFKTPLSSISLAADSMIHPNTLKTESNLKQYVEMIQVERKKLDRHVERILEVASLKKDALEIELKPVGLNDTIHQAIQYLKLIIQKSKAEIAVNVSEELMLNANPFHLKSVLVNVIENAIKYSEGVPKIRIETAINSNVVSIKIIDCGIGMTSGEVKQAFNDFYRVQSGNIHQTKGFGLGLSYCKLIIEKMNGEIELKSKVGKGTEVIIKLNLV